MLDKIAVPAITFLTTYYESLGGVFNAVPFAIFRPVQAFAGAFLGGYLVDAITGKSNLHTAKYHAMCGLQAGIGSVIGGVVGNALGQDAALFAALGASAAVYMYSGMGLTPIV